MKACIGVYSVIYVLLFIPLVFMLVKSFINKDTENGKRKKSRIVSITFLALISVLLPLLCVITVNRQPIIVMERVMNDMRAEAWEAKEESYISNGLLAPESGIDEAAAMIREAEVISIGAKTDVLSEEINGDYKRQIYHILLEPSGLMLLADVEKAGGHARILSVTLADEKMTREFIKDQFDIIFP